MRRWLRGLLIVAGTPAAVWSALAIWVRLGPEAPAPPAVFDHPPPWVMAHRGGPVDRPEHTELAFERCVELGVDVLETDVHASRDGHLVVIHDATVDRTTDGTGAVADLTLTELQALDAGHRFKTKDGLVYRGTGLRIPTLERVLVRFEEARVNVELKADQLEANLCRLLKRVEAKDRVIVASMTTERIERFRELCPGVATAASTGEVFEFWLLASVGLTGELPASVLQVPPRVGALEVITPGLIRAAGERRVPVHAFTVNDEGEMRRLLDAGIAGIITDRPETLIRVIGGRR